MKTLALFPAPDSKACTKCGETKPLVAFSCDKTHNDGRRTHCKPCRTVYATAYHFKNRDKELVKMSERNAARRVEQAGRPRTDNCEICGQSETARHRGKLMRLFYDHDHKTGEFRGWLCVRCNHVLGRVNDDTELLDKMIVYLVRSRRPKLRIAK